MTRITIVRNDYDNGTQRTYTFPVDQLEYACGVFGFMILNNIDKTPKDVRAEVDRIHELEETTPVSAMEWLSKYRVS